MRGDWHEASSKERESRGPMALRS